MKSFGYLHVDHSSSPGISKAKCEEMGLDYRTYGEGQVHEADTYKCCQCGGQVIINLLRTRERARCFKCDTWICDNCAIVQKLNPSHVHIPMAQVVDSVMDGKATWVLDHTGLNALIPKEKING